MPTTTWRAPDDVHEQLRREAYESRRPMNDLITDAVREWLERHKVARDG